MGARSRNRNNAAGESSDGMDSIFNGQGTFSDPRFYLGPHDEWEVDPAESKNLVWVQEEIARRNSAMWKKRARDYYGDVMGKTQVDMLMERLNDPRFGGRGFAGYDV